MAERRLQVTSRLGLHARAAANLVRVASQFKSSLTLQRLDGNAEADAKSILSILTLAASRGTASERSLPAVSMNRKRSMQLSVFFRATLMKPRRSTADDFPARHRSCAAKVSAFRMAS